MMGGETNIGSEALREGGRTDLAERVLLQRHASLLLRSTLAQVIFRVLNMILVLLLIGGLQPLTGWIAPASWAVLALFITVLWVSDRRSVGSQIHMIERALGKQNEYEYANLYIAYRFEASIALGSIVNRYEPYFWLVVVVLAALAFAAPWR
jgi:hypothetical protein